VEESLALRDGDVLIGRIQAASVHLTGDDGQSMELPIAEISRISLAERLSTAPPATQPAATASVEDLDGDHLHVIAPGAVQFRSRWGILNVDMSVISQLALSDGNQPVHHLVLTDGSTISGMVADGGFQLTPVDAPDSALSVPVGDLARITAGGMVQRVEPKLDMSGGDILRGSPQGNLVIQTQFGETKVAGSEIDRIALVPDSPGELEIHLRDGRTLSGGFEGNLTVRLECGLEVQAPGEMITAYARNAPAPQAQMNSDTPMPDQAVVAQVTALVKQLPGNNTQLIQRAINQLVQIGAPAVPVLNQLRPDQRPAVQRRIDTALDRIQSGDQ
jgi:hypothetical protein